MSDDTHDLRNPETRDRRGSPRGGRRATDPGKPWWRRRRLWLATASFAFIWWKKLRQKIPS
ncbi:MAG: hypothetical protein ACM3NQ_21250 [Bacteroidales bacterium]